MYGYLDAGFLETYRPYYKKFKHLRLDPYENWPDEYWVDVSDASWQDYIGRKIAGKLADKGVDGFSSITATYTPYTTKRTGFTKDLFR